MKPLPNTIYSFQLYFVALFSLLALLPVRADKDDDEDLDNLDHDWSTRSTNEEAEEIMETAASSVPRQLVPLRRRQSKKQRLNRPSSLSLPIDLLMAEERPKVAKVAKAGGRQPVLRR